MATVDFCEFLHAPGGSPVRDVHCPDLVVAPAEVETWDQTDKPYLVTSAVNVHGELRVGSGIEVRVVPRFGDGISWKSHVYLEGQAAFSFIPDPPALFTSDAATPQPGQWGGLVARSPVTIRNAIVEYAIHGVGGLTEDLVLENVTSRLNAETGLRVLNDMTATDSSFTDNGAYGIEVTNDAEVSITNSSIHGNGSYDFYAEEFTNPEEVSLVARNNWWGTTITDDIRNAIYDREDEATRPKVDWCGHLNDTGVPVYDMHCPDLVACGVDPVDLNQLDKPYLLIADLYVCPTGTLQVAAGVEIRAAEYTPPKYVWVEGTLDVNGSSGSPVTFRSNASTPQAGDWYGIWFLANGIGDLQHAVIRDAMAGVLAGDASDVLLYEVEARENETGLYVEGNGPPSVTATYSAFTDNTANGVTVKRVDGYANPSVTINYSSLHSNGGYGYYADEFADPANTRLDATKNWWGTDNAASIAAGIYDHSDVSTSPIVDWCGYQEVEGSAGRDVNCPTAYNICGGTSEWLLNDKPYLVTSDLYVCDGSTLRIGEGVDVLLADTGTPLEFLVEGTLETLGTELNPVTLTSDASVPAAGDWTGVKLAGLNGYASLSHTTISHGNNGIHLADSATADLTGVTASYNGSYGIHVADSGSATLDGVTTSFNNTGLFVYGTGPPTVTAVNSSFVDNTTYGVQVLGPSPYSYPNPSVTINSSSIHSNGGAYDFYSLGFMNAATTILDARENYWGSIDTTAIGSRIVDQRRNPSAPLVDWCRYLSSEGGPPVLDAHCPDLVVCGDETEIWDLVDKPYQVTTDFRVCSDSELQVGPGVNVRTVRLATYKPDFLIEGAFNVNVGGDPEPAIFGSDAASPAAGDWDGVELRGNSVSDIHNAEFRDGTYGLDVGDGATADLDGVTTRLNQSGLYVYGSGPPTVTVTAVNSSFVDNTTYGVNVRGPSPYSYPNPSVTINSSSIHSNGGPYDFYSISFMNAATTVLDAKENYWGADLTTETIGSRIVDQRRNPSAPRVDWCRYLSSDGGPPELDAHCPDLAVCGDETEIWEFTNKPYHVTTDFLVCSDSELQVGPGVDVRTVRLATYKPDFVIEGAFNVGGDPESPAVFGSDAEFPAAGDWDGVELRGSSVSDIHNAEFRDGTYGLDVGDGATADLDGVTTRFNQRGLYVYGSGPPTVTVTAVNSSFIDNTIYGVDVRGPSPYSYPNPSVTINSSSIHSNGGTYDFYSLGFMNAATTVLDAKENYWGVDLTTETIGSRIVDQRRNPSAPLVDWCRYLSSDGGPPELDAHCPDLVVCGGETEIWELTDKPYHVTTDFLVCSGSELQVGPGVDVRTVRLTTAKPDFVIEGAFNVNADAGPPAIFGSDAEFPAAGDWDGVELRGSSVSDIHNAEFRDGTYGLDVRDAAQATLHGATARYNGTGLYVYGTGPPEVHAANSSFVENTSYGVYVQGSPNPDLTVTRSAIHSNGPNYDYVAYPFENPDTSLVWATDNWWGTTDTTQIASRIYDHDDFASNPRVLFQAFGEECDYALGLDRDGDGHADFLDNCPERSNASQADGDLDGMGDVCDPEPGMAPLTMRRLRGRPRRLARRRRRWLGRSLRLPPVARRFLSRRNRDLRRPRQRRRRAVRRERDGRRRPGPRGPLRRLRRFRARRQRLPLRGLLQRHRRRLRPAGRRRRSRLRAARCLRRARGRGRAVDDDAQGGLRRGDAVRSPRRHSRQGRWTRARVGIGRPRGGHLRGRGPRLGPGNRPVAEPEPQVRPGAGAVLPGQVRDGGRLRPVVDRRVARRHDPGPGLCALSRRPRPASPKGVRANF